MDVGVRELKEHLSEYIDRAARGEAIVVTDRGRARAVLAPLPSAARLDDGTREGWVRRGAATPPQPAVRQRARSSLLPSRAGNGTGWRPNFPRCGW